MLGEVKSFRAMPPLFFADVSQRTGEEREGGAGGQGGGGEDRDASLSSLADLLRRPSVQPPSAEHRYIPFLSQSRTSVRGEEQGPGEGGAGQMSVEIKYVIAEDAGGSDAASVWDREGGAEGASNDGGQMDVAASRLLNV